MQIIVDHMDYVYDKGTAYETRALKDINLVINKGEYIGLIGGTGSGKSTLIQVIDGLLKPSSGTVYFEGGDIFEKDYPVKKLRSRAGLVFQYPERQLFGESVIEDVMFGPKNIGMSRLDVDLNSYEALKLVGIGEELLDVSPFELSGGEKRRVAIAGVLAMKPEVLILDEPAAGLDPEGRDDILGITDRLHRDKGITVILVSHSMEDAAVYADRIVVMNDGMIYATGTPTEIFEKYEELESIGLSVPEGACVLHRMKRRGYAVDTDKINPVDVAGEIIGLFRGRGM